MATDDIKPIPDPTVLTTAQLLRELASLRELLEARLDAADEATRLRWEQMQKMPAEAKTQIAHLQALMDERFGSVFRMFEERDVRARQATEASERAVEAALQAARELVTAQSAATAEASAKAEASTTKQIDQIGAIIKTLEKAVDARITELKERIDRGEGEGAGRQEYRTERRLDSGQVVAVTVALIALAGLVAAVLLR